jgi:5-methylcytosine-specific restriction protein B
LVLAANKVDENEHRDLHGEEGRGTDGFLAQFFSGTLMGLPAKATGNTIRPRFQDVQYKEGDYIAHQSVNLWGNVYSSRGYREWAQTGLLDMRDSQVRLTPLFIRNFNEQLEGFHFEELLVWLFAFTGFADEINNWGGLLEYFNRNYLGGDAFPAAYNERFRISEEIPWPDEQLLSERPTNSEFQQELLPSKYGSPEYNADSFLARTFLSPEVLADLEALIEDRGQIILYGPPGTGKTHVARELALYLTGGDTERVVVVQFHPAYSYEDFVIGLSPEIDEETEMLQYRPKPGTFLIVAENAAKGDSEERFVVVIDEINRGNVSRIFGELMYLLEYRRNLDDEENYTGAGQSGLSRAQIPHRAEPFWVPANVVVIGTMNSADRSIGQLDLALRRRFHFFALNPNGEVLERYLTECDPPARVEALRLFKRVNRQLREAMGTDQDLIGHTFFMDEDLTAELLRLRYNFSVLPLIQEILFDSSPDDLTPFLFENLMESGGPSVVSTGENRLEEDSELASATDLPNETSLNHER